MYKQVMNYLLLRLCHLLDAYRRHNERVRKLIAPGFCEFNSTGLETRYFWSFDVPQSDFLR